MFEVGRRYRITTTDHEGESNRYASVLDWSPPLLKLDFLGSYEIINTSSPAFVSAEPHDEAAEATKAARAKDFVDSFSVRRTKAD